ncbi:hypothetical protein DXG03_008438 [Asterophora parasitica]|uniref:Uncharacterized protein n=1 Tax=Asterophora parasitica TaxID=117018 RepID=A0A9P7KGD3_9AGAR|nr:hypothetical protein DXG03_008438 [Asterophora parasitica]
MNEFLRRGPEPAGTTGDGAGGITGPLMAQYLMALLGQRDPLNAFLGGDPATQGRMGDYVFNQEGKITSLIARTYCNAPTALDQIITQLMDNSNEHRPVPATEEIISNLPREPEHHPPTTPGPDPSSGSGRPTSPSFGSRNRSPRRDGGPDATTGFLQSLFGGIVGGGRNNASPSSSRHARANSDSAASRPQASQQGQGNGHFPGSWSEDLD